MKESVIQFKVLSPNSDVERKREEYYALCDQIADTMLEAEFGLKGSVARLFSQFALLPTFGERYAMAKRQEAMLK